MPLFELRPPAFVGIDWFIKRGFDLVVSVLVLLAGLPLWLGIAALLKLTSRGPVLFRDRRIGLGEQEFGMLKFRTMYADAAGLQAELEASNEADGPLFKIREDPRVTPVGAVLRRLSLDEIPQVWNVLRGEMSLIGPRPLPLRDYEQLENWHRKRYLVLPGVTGLWQISGRSNLDFDDLVRLDFYYLENWSIWLDISILREDDPRGSERPRRLLTVAVVIVAFESGPALARCLRSLREDAPEAEVIVVDNGGSDAEVVGGGRARARAAPRAPREPWLRGRLQLRRGRGHERRARLPESRTPSSARALCDSSRGRWRTRLSGSRWRGSASLTGRSC